MKALTVWADPKIYHDERDATPWLVVRMRVDDETQEPLESGTTLDSFPTREEAMTYAQAHAGGLPIVELP